MEGLELNRLRKEKVLAWGSCEILIIGMIIKLMVPPYSTEASIRGELHENGRDQRYEIINKNRVKGKRESGGYWRN